MLVCFTIGEFQVHQRFHLLPETLHLTVYIVDRYLESANVEKTDLQLVRWIHIFLDEKKEKKSCQSGRMPSLSDLAAVMYAHQGGKYAIMA